MAAAVLTLLLVTMPELGHLNPMITLGTALQQQQPGARVQLATLEHRRELVELAGLEFVGLGEWSEAEQENRTLNMRHAMSTKAGTPLTRMKAGAAMLCEMYAAKVSVPLVAHLAAANASNSLPDVIVADGLTAGACDAAEAFRLPLSVVWLHPTSMALQLSGYNHLNLPASVPFESLVHSVPEDASALVRYVLNPVLKRAFDALIKWLMPAPRNRARAQVGLPPLVAPAARRPHDCSATDAADGTLAPFAVQPAVPRAQFLLGITTDLNAPRALPPCWHVVGPVNIDWRSFPPKLEDEAVAAFLQQGQEAGEPVVLVAQGSMIELSQEQLSAMVDAFTQLTRPDEGHKPARILWALRSSLQASLPEDLRSCGSAGAAPSKNNSRIMVVPWLDQPAVLAHPDVHAFVSHGGLGSVHEALAAGKPVLVVPLTQSADHVIIGLQLHSRGLGEMLPASHLPRLAGAVRGLLQRGYEQRAAAVSAQWRQQGLGAQRAAAAVLDFARGGAGASVAAS